MTETLKRGEIFPLFVGECHERAYLGMFRALKNFELDDAAREFWKTQDHSLFHLRDNQFIDWATKISLIEYYSGIMANLGCLYKPENIVCSWGNVDGVWVSRDEEDSE